MIVLDRFQKLRQADGDSNLRLDVKMYHRGHVSLRPGTQVFLCIYPGSLATPSPAAAVTLPELMGTTIDVQAWPHVLRISMSLMDRPGVIHEILDSVARHGGNVLYLDSSSIEHETLHQLEAVVDFRSLATTIPKARSTAGVGSELESLVEAILLADCRDSIAWFDGRPRVKARPVRGLQRMWRALNRAGNPPSLTFSTAVLNDGTISLPLELVETINQEIHSHYGEHADIDTDTHYLLTSDTKERTFRVHILARRQLVAWCAIRHRDTPGAIAAVTDAIRKHDITILTSLNRLQSHLGISWFEAVLAKRTWTRPENMTIDDRLREIRGEIGHVVGPNVRDEFDVSVYFEPKDADAKHKVEGAGLVSGHGDRGRAAAQRLHPPRRPIAMGMWLEERERLLDSRRSPRTLSDAGTQPDDDESLGAPSPRERRLALEVGVDVVRRLTGRVRRRLFLSIAQIEVNTARVQQVRTACEDHGFVFDYLELEERNNVVTREIRERIARCTHFLAVWTPSRWDRARPNRRKLQRPSPWCLWELAVAETLERPFRVLIQDCVAKVDFEAVYSSKFFYSFGSDDGEARAGPVRPIGFMGAVEKAMTSFVGSEDDQSRSFSAADLLR